MLDFYDLVPDDLEETMVLRDMCPYQAFSCQCLKALCHLLLTTKTALFVHSHGHTLHECHPTYANGTDSAHVRLSYGCSRRINIHNVRLNRVHCELPKETVLAEFYEQIRGRRIKSLTYASFELFTDL